VALFSHIPTPLTYRIETVINKDTTIVASRDDYTHEWHTRARGCRVVSFLMWLYCDDTSGNVSKKWNKHNSFLFTAAGLPRTHVQHLYNIHFLSTSNVAPPLEMLDGIVLQLL
jgi:hypothetical protein